MVTEWKLMKSFDIEKFIITTNIKLGSKYQNTFFIMCILNRRKIILKSVRETFKLS